MNGRKTKVGWLQSNKVTNARIKILVTVENCEGGLFVIAKRAHRHREKICLFLRHMLRVELFLFAVPFLNPLLEWLRNKFYCRSLLYNWIYNLFFLYIFYVGWQNYQKISRNVFETEIEGLIQQKFVNKIVWWIYLTEWLVPRIEPRVASRQRWENRFHVSEIDPANSQVVLEAGVIVCIRKESVN